MRSHRGLLAVASAAITTSHVWASGGGGDLEMWNRGLFETAGLDPEVSSHEVRSG
jgi:hypothetical protein